MFSKKHKPLPNPVFRVAESSSMTEVLPEQAGILLGDNCYWNPENLPNGHVVAIGASGSGKTQTLKAIAYELYRTYPELNLVIIDLHGDQEIVGETCYPIHATSAYGVNPLIVNLNPTGGGPNLQTLAVAATLRKNLLLGVNQEGLLLEILGECYKQHGLSQEEKETWTRQPPNFTDVQLEIDKRVTNGCKDSAKLKIKMAASFQLGIFSKPSFPMDARLIRVDLSDLSALYPELGAIAAETLAQQLLANHRLMGESKEAKACLFVDEAKEMSKSKALDRIVCDGRKYGLNLILASQSERHLSLDIISNSSTKIVLSVDSSECGKVSKKFRFSETKLAELNKLQALVRMGRDSFKCNVIPYYQRVKNEDD